ncbi:hypothetical protein C453_03039 [Haloferax elongans ATCC BAA-1513]|uniref:Uncharacterized protein n=1 Tax=Haloferax elongans ATCC BAA-1513 TaxID=1230453 RepID=M0HUC8_HALEO|nr:hypothetical protein [Haloferax elongans]ELZ87292.1 hypothetical protein C453_03039 [Haloferax elongans ATCC BAA-1513]
MNRQNRRALVCLLVGVALLANPLYVYPESVSYETTLTYEAEATNEIPEYGHHDIDIRWCPGGRDCAVASALASGQTLRVDLPTGSTAEEYDEPLAHDYDYVRLAEGDARFYRLVERFDDGSLVLTVEPVADEAMRKAAAEESEDVPEYVQSAIETGSATVTESEAREHTWFVEHDGQYYEVRNTGQTRTPTGWGWKAPPDIVVEAMRLTGWIGGIALVWRAGEWTERGRNA